LRGHGIELEREVQMTSAGGTTVVQKGLLMSLTVNGQPAR
jgi:hypothetical protein